METRKCGFLLAESSCQAAEMSEVRECKSKLREGEEGKESKEMKIIQVCYLLTLVRKLFGLKAPLCG